MKKADYFLELNNTLFKINRQSWTEVNMLENKLKEPSEEEAGPKEMETLKKAQDALTAVVEIMGQI